jgi:hypothetical protein
MTHNFPAFASWLARLEVLSPIRAGKLQVFALRHPSTSSLGYLTLDEVLKSDVFEVTEVSEGGNVPTLKVSNRSGTPVFLMAGEELVGAKQNRILNASIMVAAGSDLPLPVSCVEAGRWRYTSGKFSSSGASAHSKLRSKMARKAAAFYQSAGRPLSDQAEVWDEVASKLRGMGSHSPSQALHQVYEDHAKVLEDLCESVRAPEGACGAIFCFGGRVAGIDVFDKPSTLAKLWPKVFRSYAIDALEAQDETAEVPLEHVKRWLAKVLEARTERYDSPGLGDDLRFDSGDLGGGSLIVDGQPVHAEVFPAIDTP